MAQEPRGGHDESRFHGEADARRRTAFLEQELDLLRAKVAESPRHMRLLEERLNESQARLAALTERNERLAATLREAREQMVQLKEEVDRLAQPPSGYGVFLEAFEDSTVDIFTSGRKLRVAVSPEVELGELRARPGGHAQRGDERRRGAWLRARRRDRDATRRSLDGGDRALVVGHTDEERVVFLADILREKPLRAGDSLLLETRSGYVYERIPKSEVEELILEEVPDIDYTDIGGLGSQIEQIRDAVELPFLHADLFREHQLRPPKGILLYGPPGCGKTLIAKAVANSLAKQVQKVHGGDEKATAFFLNIKGPELLNKYVGETERHIRLVFQRAREKASRRHAGDRVLRRDGLDLPYPRFRRELRRGEHDRAAAAQRDRRRRGPGERHRHRRLEPRGHDRPRDPAPGPAGRQDQDRAPGRRGRARHLLQVHPDDGLPIHADDLSENGGDPAATVAAMIQHTVERMYTESEENRFLEVTYANGDKETLYFKDFNSGAMIQNIVDRGKKMAIKDLLTTASAACACSTCSPRASTSSARTRTCRTRPTPTTGRGSPARRASGSSTSARSCPAARAPSRAARSTRSATPGSTL